MKSALIESVLFLLLISVVLSPIHAFGTPYIAVYFDEALTQQYADCPSAPAGSMLDTVYVAIGGFATPVEGIEFSIQFPQELMWLGELESNRGLWMGNMPTEMSMTFFSPIDASSPVIILECVVLWMCEGCVEGNIPIEPGPNLMSGYLRAVTSDLVFEDVNGQTSLICPLVVGDSPVQTAASPHAVSTSFAAGECVLECPAGDGGVILPGELPAEHHSVDLDNDGLVDIVDFSMFAAPYMGGVFDPDMDFYCSDNLDLIDFVLFTRHWLHTGSVPVEPSTWGNIKDRYSD